MSKTFNQKLLEAQKEFKKGKGGSNYDKIPMPEVVEYLRAFKATGAYPYNADVEQYIKDREEVSQTLEDYLGTEVYLAQGYLRKEKEIEYTEHMRAQGYIPIKEVTTYRGPAQLVAKRNIDFLTSNILLDGKVITSGDDRPFFVPKGRRSRGYYLDGHSLESAFIKLLK